MHRLKPIHLALIAVAIALLTAILGVVGNAIRGQEDCKKIEVNKSILFEIISTELITIRSGELDQAYMRVFGNDMVEFKGQPVPRWLKEKSTAIVNKEKLIHRLAPSECVLIFIP